MYKFQIDKHEYYDFVLTDDAAKYVRNIGDSKLFHINLLNSLSSTINPYTGEDVTLDNITLTGYDNFFINFGDGTIDPGVSYTITSGDTFTIHSVSGFTSNIIYDITTGSTYHQLNGGFYQGFFKLHGYPVEFFPSRMRKGWTVNMALHFPNVAETGTTLNSMNPNNKGFIFYLGTRAENKFSDKTPIEIQILEDDYNIVIEDLENQYDRVGYYTLSGETYQGYYHIYNGQPYTERTHSTTSELLIRTVEYSDIINNAFGIRITNDGKIGYRNIYATDICYTGDTMDVSGITNTSFVNYTDTTKNYTLKKIITDKFTIEESYTKNAVINPSQTKFLFVSVVFERDFSLVGKCNLTYGDYKNGTLSIYINGFRVYQNRKFTEVIPHELDENKVYQEGVPFNLSFGGGSQGLLESLYLDNTKLVNGIIEEFFAGTFNGGVSMIEMYGIPLYPTEIRDIITTYPQFQIPLFQGGRRIVIQNQF